MSSKNIRLQEVVIDALAEVMSSAKTIPTHTEIRAARGVLSQGDAARIIGKSRKAWQKYETASGPESRAIDPELLSLFKLKIAVMQSGLLEKISE